MNSLVKEEQYFAKKSALCTCREKGGISRMEYDKSVVNRIKRIEGQIKGVLNMIEQNKDCNEVITELSASRICHRSYNGFNCKCEFRTMCP